MCDPRFEKDTVFLVFEEDFRIDRPKLEDKGSVQYSVNKRRFAFYDKEQNVENSWGERPRSNLHMLPGRSTTQDFERFSKNEVLSDILKYITFAAEKGMGDLVWFGWNCGHATQQVKPLRFSYGSQFIAYSQYCAAELLAAINSDRIPCGDWDLVLHKFLMNPEKPLPGYSFIWPPMGFFVEHPSGCDPKNFGDARPSNRECSWACLGTRVGDDLPQRRDKWLCQWFKRGGTDWKYNVSDVVHTQRFFWKTFVPTPYRATVSFDSDKEPYWWWHKKANPPFNVFTEAKFGYEHAGLTESQLVDRYPSEALASVSSRRRRAVKDQMRLRRFRHFVQEKEQDIVLDGSSKGSFVSFLVQRCRSFIGHVRPSFHQVWGPAR